MWQVLLVIKLTALDSFFVSCGPVDGAPQISCGLVDGELLIQPSV